MNEFEKNVNTIICGDCLEVMKDWPDGVIDCCVTSPPYWGLRDYGVEGQFGLEKTPEEYVDKMVKVFAEVKRVLKPEGTLWLNLGDSYAHNTKGDTRTKEDYIRQGATVGALLSGAQNAGGVRQCHHGVKVKDLVGIPWMVAFALRQDGWWLRQDIIWHKPNPMPESVTDRCTKAHEYIFLLSKSAKYYYDNEAIKVTATTKPQARGKITIKDIGGRASSQNVTDPTAIFGADGMANKRSVWTVNVNSYSEAHFATFPADLIEPCILAGCPVGGVVMDPFMGSGTVAEVAIKHKRNYIGCEINPEYIGIGRVKAAETGVPVKEQRIGQMAMFEDKQ
jgi:DNA modification methylase